MISTDSKCGAAAAANRIIRTAPIPKFGATTTPRPGFEVTIDSTSAMRASSKPVVPTTA
jgi:hypothetical protein